MFKSNSVIKNTWGHNCLPDFVFIFICDDIKTRLCYFECRIIIFKSFTILFAISSIQFDFYDFNFQDCAVCFCDRIYSINCHIDLSNQFFFTSWAFRQSMSLKKSQYCPKHNYCLKTLFFFLFFYLHMSVKTF